MSKKSEAVLLKIKLDMIIAYGEEKDKVWGQWNTLLLETCWPRKTSLTRKDK